jgi:YbbR domain-containing protein
MNAGDLVINSFFLNSCFFLIVGSSNVLYKTENNKKTKKREREKETPEVTDLEHQRKKNYFHYRLPSSVH